jgi:hypothetical protein
LKFRVKVILKNPYIAPFSGFTPIETIKYDEAIKDRTPEFNVPEKPKK